MVVRHELVGRGACCVVVSACVWFVACALGLLMELRFQVFVLLAESSALQVRKWPFGVYPPLPASEKANYARMRSQTPPRFAGQPGLFPELGLVSRGAFAAAASLNCKRGGGLFKRCVARQLSHGLPNPCQNDLRRSFQQGGAPGHGSDVLGLPAARALQNQQGNCDCNLSDMAAKRRARATRPEVSHKLRTLGGRC